jgi:hypothetical protein
MFAESEQTTAAVKLRMKLERQRLDLWRTTARARADVGEVEAVSAILDGAQKAYGALTAWSLLSPTTLCLPVKPVLLSRRGDGLYAASSG